MCGVLSAFFSCKVTFFSRTDTGVSASEQVALLHSKSISECWLRSFNDCYNDIQVTAFVDGMIDAGSILSRMYTYCISTKSKDVFDPYCLYVSLHRTISPSCLANLLGINLLRFRGYQDFSNFCFKPTVRTRQRIIYDTEVQCTAERIVITIVGNGFLRRMVRHIISSSLHAVAPQKNYLVPPEPLNLTRIYTTGIRWNVL